MNKTAFPAPLKTILDASRYPFAVAHVRDNQLQYTLAYAESLEQCYFKTQGFRANGWHGEVIMVENREVGKAKGDNVNTYWVAV